MPQDSSACDVIALVSDLMFQSKIMAAGRSAGVTVQFVRTTPELVSVVPRSKPKLILVDLHVVADEVIKVRDVALSVGASRTVGFASHVDKNLIDAALQAGLDEAMPRSQFEHRLDELLVSVND